MDGSWLSLGDGALVVDLSAELRPRGIGIEETGVLQRRLDTGSGVASHRKLELPADVHGQRRGRVMLRRSVDVYAELGIERVRLTAVDIGRYVWAAAGFSFYDEDSRGHVTSMLEHLANELGLVIELDAPTCQPWDIAYMRPASDVSWREACELGLRRPTD